MVVVNIFFQAFFFNFCEDEGRQAHGATLLQKSFPCR